MITLYTTESCPQCELLKRLMDSHNMRYDVCKDMDVMRTKGMISVPQLEVDGKLMTFAEALKYVKECKPCL